MKKITNQSSESIVLGGLINNLSWILELSDLKVQYFSVDINRILFKTLKRLYKNGLINCDIVDIYAMIEDNPEDLEVLEEVNGIDYIQTLAQLTSEKVLDDIKAHCKTVVECAYKTELGSTMEKLSLYVENNITKSKEDLTKQVESEILELRAKYGTNNKLDLLGNRMTKILGELEKEAGRDYAGIPTGFPLLDKYVTYEKGEMVVFSAPAKFGKSQWVVDMVYRLCIIGRLPIAVIDSELSDRFFVVRLISRITGFQFNFIKTGRYKDYPQAKAKVDMAIKEIENAPLMHEYVVGWDKETVKNELKRMKIQHNLQMVIWDYLKIESIDASQSERLELAMLTNFLKNEIAGTLNVSVVALAQTSDYSNSENNLRIFGSNQIKQYASTIVYMMRKTQEQISRDLNEFGGNIMMYVKENRNGNTMIGIPEDKGINFFVDRSNATFTQAQHQNEEVLAIIEEKEEDFGDIPFDNDIGF